MNFVVVGFLNLVALTATPVDIKVDVSDFPPLVIQNMDGSFSGFEIDLFNAICQDLDLNPIYQHVEFDNIFDNILENKADVSIAGLSITSAREEIMDFSHPTLNSGFSVAVKSTDGMFINKLKNIILNITTLSIIGKFALFIIWAGLVLKIAEKDHPTFNKERFIDGWGEAIWCVLCTITTIGYGDFAAKSLIGRAFTVFIMFSGITIFTFMAGFLTSVFISSNQSDIKDRFELASQPIGTVINTSSMDEIRKIHGTIVPALNEKDMIEKLLKGDCKAIIFDSPWIINYMKTNEDITLIGDVFSKHHYGFAFSHEQYKLRSDINKSLLKLRESGVYDSIYARWFSNVNQSE